MKNKSDWTLADLILPVLSIALAIYYLTTIQGIPFIAQMYGGLLSILVIALGLVIFLVAAKKGVFKNLVSPAAYIRKNWNDPAFQKYVKVAIVNIMILLYIILTPIVGYTITSLVFLCVVMYYLGMQKKLSIIGAAIFVTVLGFGLFIAFLNVRLPLDPISEMISNMF